MELDQVTKIVSKYFAMGNIYINKGVEWVAPTVSYWVSAILLIGVIILLTLVDCPNPQLEIAQRSVLGISIAGIASPWFEQVKIQGQHLRGVAFIGLFLIVYFISPNVNAFNRCDELVAFGRVTLGYKPLEQVRVSVPEHAQEDITNRSGEFTFKLDHHIVYQHDSTRLFIHVKGLDTVVTVSHEQLRRSVLINLPDTVKAFNEAMAIQLLGKFTADHQRKIEATVNGRVVELEGKVSSQNEINDLYKAYDQIDSYYRNEFEFIGHNQKINYRKNLIDAGILEVDPLEPYLAHHLDSNRAFLIEDLNLSETDFSLEYAFLNTRPLFPKIMSIESVDELTNKIKVHFTNNIRAVIVRLERTESTDLLKKRDMRFYGFLPEEEFTMRYLNGQWKLQ